MRIIVVFSLLALFLNACQKSVTPADLIISGTIYTAEDDQPVVDAVAVSGDTIVYAGSYAEALKYKGPATRLIELGTRIMTPGFIDGHAHILGLGYQEMQLNLMDVRNYEELVERVREAATRAKPGEWIVGRGWHQDKWDHVPDRVVKGFQTHHLLSAASPENPVFLAHASGHAGMANAKAMELAGISVLNRENPSSTNSPAGGEIIRDDHGNPTGIFTENAMELIEDKIPPSGPESDARALELAMDACLRNGITGFHDAGEGKEALELLQRFKNENKLRVRMYVMLENDWRLRKEWYAKGPAVDADHWLTIRSIKLYCDGALGSRGAWLLQPYSDRKETSGLALLPMDSVKAVALEAVQNGFQLCSHAIGDRANREILDAYENAFASGNRNSSEYRFRIEHAQHVDPADIPRFGKMGVIPAMQAIHMSSDRPWAIERLGEQRIVESAYMWQSLLKSGARIVNGTDAPVEPVNPIACFYASVSRKTLKAEPDGGYEPAEKMTREQALRSYTIDAAYGAFEENIKGSIRKGKLADFTIFSADIMKVPDDEILSATVEMTIVGGELVYEREEKKREL